MSINNISHIKSTLVAVALGIISFWLVYGFSIVDPSNILWLYTSDPKTYFLSGAFFQLDQWRFPPGANPMYGGEIPSAIGLADAIPFMGFIFKIIASFTKIQYQYVGIWLLICNVLLSVSTYFALSKYSKYELHKFIAIPIILFAPFYLSRGLTFNHWPLEAQFLIVFAIYLYGEKSLFKWLSILSLAILSNMYIFAMVFLIWGAQFLKSPFLTKEKFLNFSITLCFLILVMFFSGYFVLNSNGYSSGGFGIYKANVLSMFDSKPNDMIWSYFLPGTPKTSINHNAPNFIGFGGILLLCVYCFQVIQAKSKISVGVREKGLLVITLLMLIYSFSNQVSFGSYQFSYPLPQIIIKYCNALRDSGRFMWPFLYLVLLASIINISNKFRYKTATLILLFCSLSQILDTSIAWKNVPSILKGYEGKSWPSVLKDPMWDLFPEKYSKLSYLPVTNHHDQYAEFAYYALINKMATNSVYLSRSNDKDLEKINDSIKQSIRNKNYAYDTLYIIKEDFVDSFMENKSEKDYVGILDGFMIFAPGFYTKFDCLKLNISCNATFTRMEIKINNKDFLPYGKAVFNTQSLSVESTSPTDAGYQLPLNNLRSGAYNVKFCYTFHSYDPSNSNANFSVYGNHKILEINRTTTKSCQSRYIRKVSEEPLALSFGLGGWGVGSGFIKLDSINLFMIN